MVKSTLVLSFLFIWILLPLIIFVLHLVSGHHLPHTLGGLYEVNPFDVCVPHPLRALTGSSRRCCWSHLRLGPSMRLGHSSHIVSLWTTRHHQFSPISSMTSFCIGYSPRLTHCNKTIQGKDKYHKISYIIINMIYAQTAIFSFNFLWHYKKFSKSKCVSCSMKNSKNKHFALFLMVWWCCTTHTSHCHIFTSNHVLDDTHRLHHSQQWGAGPSGFKVFMFVRSSCTWPILKQNRCTSS